MLPSFDHANGDPVEDDIIVEASDKIIIVEGLYTLLGRLLTHPWHAHGQALCLLCPGMTIPAVILQCTMPVTLAWGLSAWTGAADQLLPTLSFRRPKLRLVKGAVQSRSPGVKCKTSWMRPGSWTAIWKMLWQPSLLARCRACP